MATSRAGFVPLIDFAASLLAEREVFPRGRLIAEHVVELIPDSACQVYILQGEEWKPRGHAGEITLEPGGIHADTGTLGSLNDARELLVFPASELTRENYPHLHLRRTFQALGYVPILWEGEMIGALEVISYATGLDAENMASVVELQGVAAVALDAALKNEAQHNANLQSIARLTELYDIELVFNSTLEMDELMPIITSKIQQLMNVQAVNLWLVEADDKVLMAERSGFDMTVPVKALQGVGEGVAADVCDKGESVLIADMEDERLKGRNGDLDEGAVFSLICVPIIHEGNCVGALEAINQMSGEFFDEDDEFLLTTISQAAAVALNNASLMHAQRKVEILETLVTVSQEITSTLNLERMLETIVNAPQAVIPYERAAVALEQHGKFKLSAVTGVTNLNVKAPEIAPLNEILEWAAFTGEVLDIRQYEGEINDTREETRAKFHRYFEKSGMRAFYTRPLTDDTGRVGIFCMESSDPDFLSPAHLEIVQVLAGQATVALRNAQLYKEVPFISVLEPVLERKRKFMAQGKRRRFATYYLTAALAVFLVVFPLPMRVDGGAVAAPAYRAQVQPEVEGVVRKVYVREGDPVSRNQIIAELGDWDYAASVSAAQAKYQTAMLLMNRALASNDGTEAGIQRVQTDYWRSEVARAQQTLDRTRLRSPIDGIVATPHIEDFIGRKLDSGTSFAEIIDASHAVVDVAIDDEDVGLMTAGDPASVKLNFYPTHTFRGEVSIISPKGELQNNHRVFFARVTIPNEKGMIRTGMEGRGKVRVGWRPAGYVLFRGMAVWFYTKLWNWLGW